MSQVELQDPDLDAADPHTRLLLLAEYWKNAATECRIERDELRWREYCRTPTLDAFDEYDICDSFAGLPVEFFNPGPSFA